MSKLAKFRKAVEKKDKFNIGLSPINEWISTGNAALNEIISGDMRLGIPVGRSTIFAGLQGSGKSFIVSNIAKNAQASGYEVVYIDTEYSLTDGFMTKIGVSMEEDVFLGTTITTIEGVIEFMSELFQNTDKTDKILVILDSLSVLQPGRDIEKFTKGEAAYGQGLREKMLKQLVTNINGQLGNRNMAFVTTCHMYVNGSDVYGNPILKPNVGEGTLYIPSVGVQMNKKPLKDGKEAIGISVGCKTFKTRFTMLGKECSFSLPWDRGMDFLDGAIEVLEAAKVVERNGAWYSYTNPETGEVIKFQRKNFDEHSEVLMDMYASSRGEPSYVESEEEEILLES